MQVPSGFHATLPAGTPVIIQQHLGGAFTAMTAVGGLVRVDGKDADALGPDFVEEARKYEAERAAVAEGPFDEEKVWAALREVYDPEIPSNIVELGLVYFVAVEPVEGGHRVKVVMTLTAPGVRHRARHRGRRPPPGARRRGRQGGGRRARLRPPLGFRPA